MKGEKIMTDVTTASAVLYLFFIFFILKKVCQMSHLCTGVFWEEIAW